MNSSSLQKYFLSATIILLSCASYAKDGYRDLTYQIQPLFGFETVYKSTPTPHTVTQTMYGVRLTGGVDILSAEIEYTKGTGQEDFQTAPEKIKSTDEKLKLGGRSTFNLSGLFNFSVRFGGQAKKSTEESISGGVSTINQKPIEYSPYIGAAFGLHLGKLNISLGTTVVIKDVNDFQKNEYQNVIAVGVGI